MSEKEKIILEDGKLYHAKDLFAYLRGLGLPFSRPTLIKYESAGILSQPQRVKYYNKSTRVYTAQEIKDVALKIYTAIADHTIKPHEKFSSKNY